MIEAQWWRFMWSRKIMENEKERAEHLTIYVSAHTFAEAASFIEQSAEWGDAFAGYVTVERQKERLFVEPGKLLLVSE